MRWIRNIFLFLASLFGLVNFLLSVLTICDTLVEKPGLWGAMHLYYSLGKSEYILINIGIAVVSLILFIWPIVGLRNQTNKTLRLKAIILSCVCIVIIIMQLFLLESFFVGKP
jgi:hypothetical protein